jgi:hypothetical protein
MINLEKITIEFNHSAKMWQAIHTYSDRGNITIMDTQLKSLVETVLTNIVQPEELFLK